MKSLNKSADKKGCISNCRLGLITLCCMMLFGTTLTAQKKIVGYIPTGYTTAEVDYTRITHLNIAFENPDSEGNLSYTAGNDAFITTAHDNNVKVLVSIGGGGASNDAALQQIYFNLITPANRPAFISKIVSYIDAHNLDGLDLDLEGSAINADYSGFAVALKNALPSGKLLTAALTQDNGGNNVSSAAVQTFDYLNVMAYDMGWGQAVNHSPYSYAVTSANWWVANKGIQPAKIILGVPFYGYTNTTGNGGISFGNILNTYGAAAAQQDKWISGADTIYYNGIPTIRQKSQLVLDKGYGGIMIWQLAQDATGANSLLTNIQQVLSGGALPLTLLSFSAVTEKGFARLIWKTTNEVNTSYFNVQRSGDGVNFTSIARVAAKEAGAQTNEYNYLDNMAEIRNSKVYYRLQQLDKDGKISYSKITAVEVSAKSSYNITPNPAKGYFMINASPAAAENSTLLVCDLAGNAVVKKNLTNSASQKVDITRLSKGMYIIKIIAAGIVQTQKLQVQ